MHCVVWHGPVDAHERGDTGKFRENAPFAGATKGVDSQIEAVSSNKRVADVRRQGDEQIWTGNLVVIGMVLMSGKGGDALAWGSPLPSDDSSDTILLKFPS